MRLGLQMRLQTQMQTQMQTQTQEIYLQMVGERSQSGSDWKGSAAAAILQILQLLLAAA